MRIRTTASLATAAAAASMVLLAGCGGDGPKGASPPPATTEAAPTRNAASWDLLPVHCSTGNPTSWEREACIRLHLMIR